MTISPVSSDAPIDPNTLKRAGAARDFEAILITELLQTSRGADGWLGTGEDQSSDAAFGLGEQELAKAMASSGGLGLAKLIDQGLQHKP